MCCGWSSIQPRAGLSATVREAPDAAASQWQEPADAKYVKDFFHCEGFKNGALPHPPTTLANSICGSSLRPGLRPSPSATGKLCNERRTTCPGASLAAHLDTATIVRSTPLPLPARD